MTDSLIVALVILVGVFLVMIVTIIRAGHEAAIKMWGVMGALTGVAFGAITTYYFTDQVRKHEIATVRADAMRLELALAQATTKASDAESLVSSFYSVLSGKIQDSAAFPVGAKYATALPEGERTELAARLQRTTELLLQIQALGTNLPTYTASATKKK